MNKKRPRFQVNEEKLKMMMAGDIPMKVEPSDLTIIHEEEDQAKESRDAESIGITAPADEKKNTGEDKTGKRKKSDMDKYMELFLAQPSIKPRRQRTMLFDDELYDRIYNLINVPGGISFSNFIFNMVSHHFETYKDVINNRLRSIANNIYNKTE